MELLFGGVKSLDLHIPEATTIADLLQILRRDYLKDRPELFLYGDTVRPGILVLINDVDWELEGQTKYQIKNKDNIVFISTLHGG